MAWAPNYADSLDLASYLRVEDGVDEAAMDLAIAAASRAVDEACHRQFGTVTGSRIYSARVDWDGRRVVDVDDLQSVTSVEVDWAADGGFATTLSDGYALGPANAAIVGLPYTQLVVRAALPTARDSVRVTGTWGWASVPEAIKAATYIQASRFLARRNSPFGVAGSPDTGSELRLLAKVDPDVAVMLKPFARNWWVA